MKFNFLEKTRKPKKITTRLFLKYTIGVRNVQMHASRVWELVHDGSSVDFARAWLAAESKEFDDWYSLMLKHQKSFTTDHVTKDENESSYYVDGDAVSMHDVTVLWRENIK